MNILRLPLTRVVARGRDLPKVTKEFVAGTGQDNHFAARLIDKGYTSIKFEQVRS